MYPLPFQFTVVPIDSLLQQRKPTKDPILYSHFLQWSLRSHLLPLLLLCSIERILLRPPRPLLVRIWTVALEAADCEDIIGANSVHAIWCCADEVEGDKGVVGQNLVEEDVPEEIVAEVANVRVRGCGLWSWCSHGAG